MKFQPPQPDRSARRAFIRANHPDRGGDPDAFINGLSKFDKPPANSRVQVHGVSNQRWPAHLIHTVRRLVRREHRPPRVH